MLLALMVILLARISNPVHTYQIPHRLSKTQCKGTRMEPTPIQGCAGVLGSGLAGFLKSPAHYAKPENSFAILSFVFCIYVINVDVFWK
jgi:hypothetical protein